MREPNYISNDKYMFRIPTAHSQDIILTKENLLEVCRDDEFREKIKIASPSLLKMIDNYFLNPESLSEKSTKNLFCSIAKYYNRSKERTTPFGLFAAVGVGSFSTNKTFSVSEHSFYKCVSIDTGWLYGFICDLEKKFCDRLSFKWNPACISDGNRVRLLYTTTKGEAEISIRKTHATDTVMTHCMSFASYSTILDSLANEYPNTDRTIFTNYLNELVSKQILISDLRPSLTDGNQLEYLIQKCRVSIPEMVSHMLKLRQLCINYEKTKIGCGMDVYDETISFMQDLFHSQYYLQVDVNSNDTKFVLDMETKGRVEKLAKQLVVSSTLCQPQNKILSRYREKFIEKYGIGRLVPITEMLDTAIGIGAPFGYMSPQNDFYEANAEEPTVSEQVRNVLLNKYERAILQGTSIKLDLEELGIYAEQSDDSTFPTSFELYFRLTEEDEKTKIYLSDCSGSNCAGKTFGRFAQKNHEFAEIVFELNRKEQDLNGDIKSCEISFLPSEMRNGNVLHCVTGREFQLSAYIGETCTTRSIRIEDVFIGATEKSFYAIDARTKKRIIFEMNNMYNPLLQPNVFRFLVEITHENETNWGEFPWRYVYRHFKHIPRIETEDVVLSEEQWRVSLSDLDKADNWNSFIDAFSAFAKEFRLPHEVYLVENDNRISLRLNNTISLAILFDEIKRKNGDSVVLQRKESGSNIKFDDGEYATEIVVPFFRSTPKDNSLTSDMRPVIARNEHIVLPYSNWLYFKLYCKHEREEELIALELNEFGKKLHIEFGLNHFFMRYIDTKPHIRLRFHGSAHSLLNATPAIMLWIGHLQQENIIGDMVVSSYEKEIERYGGSHLIEYAETVFMSDSLIAEELLCLARLKKTSLSIFDMTLLSTIKYLECFYEDFYQRLEFCTKNYLNNSYRKQFNTARAYYMKLFDMENSWDAFAQTQDGNAILTIIDKRRPLVIDYCRAIEDTATPSASKEDIVASILHLHCNRMLGTDRENERKLMSFTASLLYSKKHLYGGHT